MRSGVLWALLPDEVLPLIIMVAGLMMIVGLRRAGLSVLVTALLLPVLAPFVEALFGELPVWVSFVVLAFIGLAILRGLAALLIGQRAADTMVGSLAADVVRIVVGLLFFPLRAAWWALRMIGR
jgi:hypothetical protein